LDVPTIDLVLEGGVEWKIYGGNLMVLVNKKVACLGFVDGGKDPMTSVVIGGHLLLLVDINRRIIFWSLIWFLLN
jgi:hypothetical protein